MGVWDQTQFPVKHAQLDGTALEHMGGLCVVYNVAHNIAEILD